MKTIKTVCACIIAYLIFIGAFYMTQNNTYTVAARVSYVCNDIVGIEMNEKEVFEFYADDNEYNINDMVVVTFDDNGTTDNIYDDEIISVKK